MSLYRYAKANNKYMKINDKKIDPSYFLYFDANNLYGWTMSQKLPAGHFKWIDDLSIFSEDFIKNYNENSDIRDILEVSKKFS